MQLVFTALYEASKQTKYSDKKISEWSRIIICKVLIMQIANKSPCILTYPLTPYSTVLVEKLTDSAASQEIPRIFGTRRFLTVFTSARHLSLS